MLLQIFLVTEYMQGGDLSCALKRNRHITSWYQQGRLIVLGIARGLVYLHSNNVVWWDCKPGNVLLDHTKVIAKIADFGLAKVLTTTHTAGFMVGILNFTNVY